MPNKQRKSRSRSRNCSSHSNQRDTRHRRRSPSSNILTETMQQILNRLASLEEQHHPASSQQREPNGCAPAAIVAASATPPPPSRSSMAESAGALHGYAGRQASAVPPSPERPVSAAVDHSSTADRIIDAIRSINIPAQTTGKLDSCMRGPYRVVKALPHGRYELQLLAGSYGKSTQAAAEFMVPWRGEWTPETCSAFFEDADCNDDDAESTHERAAEGDDMPSMPDPVPSASGAAGSCQPEIWEAENVLQSGEAVLDEDDI